MNITMFKRYRRYVGTAMAAVVLTGTFSAVMAQNAPARTLFGERTLLRSAATAEDGDEMPDFSDHPLFDAGFYTSASMPISGTTSGWEMVHFPAEFMSEEAMDAPASGYVFPTTSGQTYELTLNVTNAQYEEYENHYDEETDEWVYTGGFSLGTFVFWGGALSMESIDDMFLGVGGVWLEDGTSTSISTSFRFTAKTNTTRIFALFERGKSADYTISIAEWERDPYTLTDMTLPFEERLTISPANNATLLETDNDSDHDGFVDHLAVIYKLVVSEEMDVTFSSEMIDPTYQGNYWNDVVRVRLFSDAALLREVWDDRSEYDNLDGRVRVLRYYTLSSDTYYVAITDNGYFLRNEEYLTADISVTGVKTPVSFRGDRVNRAQSSLASRVSIRNRTLTVRPLSSETARVRLIDMRGRSVANFTANGATNFSLARVPAGRYLVEVRDGARRERVTVMVGVR